MTPEIAKADSYYIDQVGVRRFIREGDPLPAGVTADDLEQAPAEEEAPARGRRPAKSES
ncbi:MAG TPA: hypothetical protein VGJ32_16525 [Solirubrobacteraceae bacterium]|jgi:hypothetical protein